MRQLLFALCGVLIFAASSCAQRVEGFDFHNNGESVALRPDSREGWKEPGIILLEPGKHIIFRFENPVAVEQGFALRLAFREYSGGLELIAYKEESGNLITAAQSPLFTAAEGGFSLNLPPGTYGGFGLRKAKGTAPEEAPDLRILGAAIVPYEAVYRLDPSGACEASSGVFPKLPRREGGILVTLSSARGAAESLRVTLSAGDAGDAFTVSLRRGASSHALAIQPRPLAESVYFHSRFLGFVPDEIEIPSPPPGRSLEILLLGQPEWSASSSSFAPIPADLGQILSMPSPAESRSVNYIVVQQ